MEKVKKKKNEKLKYLFYALFVLFATGIALFFSLKDSFSETVNVLKECNVPWLFATLGVTLLFLGCNALIVYIFCRTYTRKYKYSSAFANIMIGEFYSGITPGASGGQPMQVYTMSKQGVDISNGASIFVMWSILYEFALVILGTIGFITKIDLIKEINSIPVSIGDKTVVIPIIPLVIIGFIVNLGAVFVIVFVSYSKRLQDFVINHGVSLFAKMKLVKNPNKTRETLRIRFENFRIELRRLQANIPLTSFLLILFVVYLLIKFSIPWFAGAALNGYGEGTMGQYSFKSIIDASIICNFHQMIVGLIPIPGAAGVSELFFSLMFGKFYLKEEYITAAQIIWRTAYFHIPLLIGGLVSAFYKASPKEHIELANRQTFIDLQIKTYEERKKQSDTLFETSKLSSEEIKRRLKQSFFTSEKENDKLEEMNVSISPIFPNSGSDSNKNKVKNDTIDFGITKEETKPSKQELKEAQKREAQERKLAKQKIKEQRKKERAKKDSSDGWSRFEI